MPLDSTGAPAPRPLTTWIEHLNRRKIAAKKVRATVRKRRVVTEQRLCRTEQALGDIIAGADIIADIAINDDELLRPISGVCLLVTLERWQFEQLCALGAELEDLEDSCDHEPEVDEHTLGRSERVMQPEEDGSDDGEPSLGSTGMVDQRRWHEGDDRDLELDRADDEPSHGADAPELDCCDQGEPKDYQIVLDRTIINSARERYKPRPEPERVGSLTYATVDPKTQRAGMWVMQRRTDR